jgi:hypothetical protein
MTRRTWTTLCLAITLAVMLPHIASAQNYLVGTWKLNLEKSKFNPGPAPKSNTATYEAVGEATKVTTEGVDAEGKPTKSVFGPYLLDGKPSPVTGVPAFNESTFKKVNETTVEFTRLKDGKPVQTGTRVVSADGKTLTFTTTGVNASGQQYNNVAVFEKQ